MERFVRLWAALFFLGGLVFLAGATSLFRYSRLPQTGWVQVGCAVVFFVIGLLLWFRAGDA